MFPFSRSLTTPILIPIVPTYFPCSVGVTSSTPGRHRATLGMSVRKSHSLREGTRITHSFWNFKGSSPDDGLTSYDVDFTLTMFSLTKQPARAQAEGAFHLTLVAPEPYSVAFESQPTPAKVASGWRLNPQRLLKLSRDD